MSLSKPGEGVDAAFVLLLDELVGEIQRCTQERMVAFRAADHGRIEQA